MHKLHGIGLLQPKELVGAVPLSRLPAEYQPMIIALESLGAKITTDLAKTKILKEVAMTGSGANHAGETHGFLTYPRP